MTEIDKLYEHTNQMGGGKSKKQISTQAQGLIDTNKQLIAEARARGDKAEVKRLTNRNKTIRKIAKNYKDNINRLSEHQQTVAKDFKLASTNLGKANRALDKAKANHENAQKSGDAKAIARTQKRLDKAQKRADRANAKYDRTSRAKSRAESVVYGRSTYQNNGATRYNANLVGKTYMGGVGQARGVLGKGSRARSVNNANNELARMGSNLRYTNSGRTAMGAGRYDNSRKSQLIDTRTGRYAIGGATFPSSAWQFLRSYATRLRNQVKNIRKRK